MDFSKLPSLDALSFSIAAQPTEKPKTKQTAAQATGLGNLPNLQRAPTKRYYYDLTTSRRAMETIGRLPSEEETFHCIMGGDFHGFDIIIAIQEMAAQKIERLTITTLGFNRHNISHLCGMIDADRAANVSLLCSEYFRDSDRGTYDYAARELLARDAKLAALRNHSKIVCLQFADRAFVVESSANLRSCNNLEQFSLTRSQPLHDFHVSWINRIFPSA
jgi:hypothetical protein